MFSYCLVRVKHDTVMVLTRLKIHVVALNQA